MIEKYLNNRFLTLYAIPLVLGSLTTLSFAPFNLLIVNFLYFLLFYLLVYINKNLKQFTEKNLIKKIYLYLD